ncbi:MAG: hypothetical protein ACYTF1_16330, partial [Planctomycetota bacterium]
LLADAGGKKGGWQRDTYSQKIKTLRELPCCVGWHLCGAYLRNHARKAGVRNERLQPDQKYIDEMMVANRETAAFVRETAAN